MAGNAQLKEWKGRWALVEQAVEDERSMQTEDWRFRQMLKLNATGRALRLSSVASDDEIVRARWCRLREVIGGRKSPFSIA